MNLNHMMRAAHGRFDRRTRAFIQEHFGNGEQGVFYVPQPTMLGKQALYRDSPGTTAADANGDPVGLGMELSQGLVLGPELVVGGDFSNGIPEVITPHSDASIEVENGRLKITLVGDYYGSMYIKRGSLGVGTYLVEFDYETKDTTGSGYSVRCPDTGGDYSVSLPTNTVGHFSGIITNPTDNQEIYIRGDRPTEPWFVDNITIRELPGNHLTQSVSADRPTYGTDGVRHWVSGDGTSDFLEAGPFDLTDSWFVAWAGVWGAFGNYPGPWRLLAEGENPSATTTNRLEEYTRGGRDRVLYSRRDVQGVASDRSGVFPAPDTPLVAWANRNPGVEIAVGEEFAGSTTTHLDVPDLPYSVGSANLHLFRGYTGDFMNGQLYAFIFLIGGATIEQRKAAVDHLKTLAGVP